MLAAAARIEALGEHELAHHMRAVARGLEPVGPWRRRALR